MEKWILEEIRETLENKEDFEFTEGIHQYKTTFNKDENRYQLLQKINGSEEYNWTCVGENDLNEFLFLIND